MPDLVRILYIDDSALDRELVRDALVHEHGGFVITEARSEKEIHALLGAQPYDLVLSDFHIGGFEGTAVIDAVHAYDPQLPVVIVTGTGNEETAVQALQRGALDYVIKTPQHIRRLPNTILTALEKGRARAERDKAAEALRASEQLNRSILNSLNAEICLMDAEGNVVMVNHAWDQFARANGNPMQIRSGMGTNYLEVTRLAAEKGLTSAVDTLAGIERVLRGELGEFFLEYPAHSPDERRWFLLHVTPLPLAGNLLVISHQDITSPKRAEERIRTSEARFRSVFENASVGIVLANSEGFMRSLNQAMHDLLGYEPGALENKHFADITFHQDLEWDLKNFRALYAGEIQDYSLDKRFVRKDGTLVWARLTVSLVRDENNTPQYSVAVVEDIDARKQAEQAITRQLEETQTLYAIDNAIVNSSDLEGALVGMMAQIVRGLHADAAQVLRFQPSQLALEPLARHGFHAPLRAKTSLRLGEGVAGHAALENMQRHPVHMGLTNFGALASAEQYPSEHFDSYHVMSLRTKGQLRGVLQVWHRAAFQVDAKWDAFLEAIATQLSIALEDAQLFRELQRSNLELTLAYDTTLEGWVQALDVRDKAEGHTRRVTELTLKLGRGYGVNESDLSHLKRGALMHDIGKLAIPEAILSKPGPLTPEEWVVMKQHPTYAHEWLSPISFLRPALDVPYSHHECWDGSGYPRGLRGEQIPLFARLFAVADVWDSLTSDRPYRPAWASDQARAHLIEQAGVTLDPKIVRLFLQVV